MQLSSQCKSSGKKPVILGLYSLTNAFNKYLLSSFMPSTMWAWDVVGNMRNVVPPSQRSPASPREMGIE